MRKSMIAVGLCMVLSTLTVAQTSFSNSGFQGPANATTTGTSITLDQSGFPNLMIGTGSAQRVASTANSSYLPTGWAIDPTADGSLFQTRAGFTIQWWYQPSQPSLFHYIGGDASWVGANGAFRFFANGAAGVNQVIIRGPLTQLATVGAPLGAATLALNNGWVHLAIVYDNTTQAFTWYVNGVVDNAGAANSALITGTGTNLTWIGYNGSSAAGPEGRMDDIRIYDYARPAGDILADYNNPGGAGTAGAPSTGPSGEFNTPTVYYPCDAAQNPHVAHNSVGAEGSDTGVRLFGGGTTCAWGATSNAGAFPATAIMNIHGPFSGGGSAIDARNAAYRDPPAMPTSYLTPAAPGLEVGHGLSFPVNPFPVVVPDGLGVGSLLTTGTGGLVIPLPYGYGNPDFSIGMPPAGFFNPGDRLDLQFVTIDSTWVGSVATTNRICFAYTQATPGAHFHAEARGVGSIQDTGFWEIWNTGDVDIVQVHWDLSTSTGGGAGWNPGGALNSGGTLATNDSIRFATDAHTGLIFNATAVLPFTPGTPDPTAVGFNDITFDFSDFTANINHFIFDCDDTVGNLAGSAFIGSTVTVTFADTTVLTGTLIADPADINGAILDL